MELNSEDYKTLHNDVKTILSLLEDDKQFGRLGLVTRVRNGEIRHEKAEKERGEIRQQAEKERGEIRQQAEKERQETRQQIENLKMKIVIYSGTAAAIAAAAIQGLIGYFF